MALEGWQNVASSQNCNCTESTSCPARGLSVCTSALILGATFSCFLNHNLTGATLFLYIYTWSLKWPAEMWIGSNCIDLKYFSWSLQYNGRKFNSTGVQNSKCKRCIIISAPIYNLFILWDYRFLIRPILLCPHSCTRAGLIDILLWDVSSCRLVITDISIWIMSVQSNCSNFPGCRFDPVLFCLRCWWTVATSLGQGQSSASQRSDMVATRGQPHSSFVLDILIYLPLMRSFHFWLEVLGAFCFDLNLFACSIQYRMRKTQRPLNVVIQRPADKIAALNPPLNAKRRVTEFVWISTLALQ